MKTLIQLSSDYETNRFAKGYSSETTQRVSRTVGIFARDVSPKLRDLTNKNIFEWADRRREAGTAQSTVYADFNSLRSFMRFLDDSKIKYPATKNQIYCKPAYRDPVCLSPEEIRDIIGFADYETGLLIRLLYTGGMRISEALNMTIDDLGPNNEIRVTNSKWCKDRTIFIYDNLRKELQWQGEKNGGRLFLAPDGRDLNRKTAYYHIKRAMIAAGYPNASPHSLRHGFATTLIRKGANLSYVQRLLGHSHIETTMRYEHLVTDDLASAHERFLPQV